MRVDLAYSVMELIAATQARDKAMSECDHSWGYYGQAYEERVAKAIKSIEDDIEAIVAAKLAEVQE